MDIHFIFIEHGMVRTAASQGLIDGGHFPLFMGIADVQSGRGPAPDNPSLGSQRRIVEACNVRRQLRLSSSAISSVLQRER